MTSVRNVTLVVGADSAIGQSVLAELLRQGKDAVGTTRRRERVDDDCLWLDLSSDLERWQPPFPVGAAVLCAGATKFAACERDPEQSAQVNIHGTVTLGRRLIGQGAFLILLSSNAVFDGTVPFAPAEAPVSPTTEYGRQKCEAERRLRELSEEVAIVRFSKVLSPRDSLLHSWLVKLRQGTAIHPFSDRAMAPVSLAFAVRVLELVTASRTRGIVQASANRDITYAEAAHYLARRIGADASLVQPTSMERSGLSLRNSATHTTLNSSRLDGAFGIEAPTPWAAIDAAIGM